MHSDYGSGSLAKPRPPSPKAQGPAYIVQSPVQCACLPVTVVRVAGSSAHRRSKLQGVVITSAPHSSLENVTIISLQLALTVHQRADKHMSFGWRMTPGTAHLNIVKS